MKNIPCIYCGSFKLFKFRLDSDWAYGAGDLTMVNEKKYYTLEEQEYDSYDRYDLEIYQCFGCGRNYWKE